ncbi:LOW QUALITY PROTEIN: integrin alpha-11-like [Lampetra planeri]
MGGTDPGRSGGAQCKHRSIAAAAETRTRKTTARDSDKSRRSWAPDDSATMKMHGGSVVIRLAMMMQGFCQLGRAFNVDVKNAQIFSGSAETQFGYTVKQHVDSSGEKWLLVGAPWEGTPYRKMGDVYKCPIPDTYRRGCVPLHLSNSISVSNATELQDNMTLGMTLVNDPISNGFLACGPLWAQHCGSSYFTAGVCTNVSADFQVTSTLTPAAQRCGLFMDIVIVLDGSNSIYPWQEVQNFLINIVKKFHIGPGQTRVGLVQYGETAVHEFTLSDYETTEQVVQAAKYIEQRGGRETRTAYAVNHARSEAFSPLFGAREGASKVMIVVTDGESHDSEDLTEAIAACERDNITRYAIAVLGYYKRKNIDPSNFISELKAISSEPEEKHFINVADEAALNDIVGTLGERIFSLEGTVTQNETSFDMEMSQVGFSAAVVKDGILLGAVGAYDWGGSVVRKRGTHFTVPARSAFGKEAPVELQNHAAYLGYSVGSARPSRYAEHYIAGAPRFNHTGKVLIFSLDEQAHVTVHQAIHGDQIGSYFGSEVLSVDVDCDGVSDLLLVGAPMYLGPGNRETGRVYVYTLTQRSFRPAGFLHAEERQQDARFGSAIALLPDINQDGLADVVVGAPLEDGHRGALYIYHGRGRTLRPQPAQRVAAVDVSSSLVYFGRSVDARLDVDGNGIVDLSVGALGNAVLLRSRSIVHMNATVTFSPPKVILLNKSCLRNGKDSICVTATVCFHATARSPLTPDSDIWLAYTSNVDASRVAPRAFFDETAERTLQRELSVRAGGRSYCQDIGLHLHEVTDFVRPISLQLDFALQDPNSDPVLDAYWPMHTEALLPFANDCGDDEECVSDLVLHLRSDVQGSSMAPYVIRSGRRRTSVWATLENRGENAYNARVNVSFSRNLRLASITPTVDQGLKMECQFSHEEADGGTTCSLSPAVFRPGAKLVTLLEFEFSRSVFLPSLDIGLRAESDSKEMLETLHDNAASLSIPVRYEAEILFTRDSNLHQFEVSREAVVPDVIERPEDIGPQFNYTLTVQNLGLFPLARLEVLISVPAITPGGNPLLTLSHVETDVGVTCRTSPETDWQQLIKREATLPVYEEDLRAMDELNCATGRCHRVACVVETLEVGQEELIHIKGWLWTPSLTVMKFKSLKLNTTAELQLNRSQLILMKEDSRWRYIVMEITKERGSSVPLWIIIGSVLGGLLLLALLIYMLWKMGFFRRHYLQLIRDNDKDGRENLVQG